MQEFLMEVRVPPYLTTGEVIINQGHCGMFEIVPRRCANQLPVDFQEREDSDPSPIVTSRK